MDRIGSELGPAPVSVESTASLVRTRVRGIVDLHVRCCHPRFARGDRHFRDRPGGRRSRLAAHVVGWPVHRRDPFVVGATLLLLHDPPPHRSIPTGIVAWQAGADLGDRRDRIVCFHHHCPHRIRLPAEFRGAMDRHTGKGRPQRRRSRSVPQPARYPAGAYRPRRCPPSDRGGTWWQSTSSSSGAGVSARPSARKRRSPQEVAA